MNFRMTRVMLRIAILVFLAIVLGATTRIPWWRIQGWPTAAEWQAFGAVGTMIVATVAASYAWKQVVESIGLRREQAQPYVLATPIAALSEGRQACLVIKNYGPRAAYNLAVHFPGAWVSVPAKETEAKGVWTGTRDLRLAVSALAPGQEIHEWINIMDEEDDVGVRSADIEVTFSDSSNDQFKNSYRISHGPLGLFGRADPLTEISDQLNQIQKTFKNWSSPDGTSLNCEIPRESQSRIFGQH